MDDLTKADPRRTSRYQACQTWAYQSWVDPFVADPSWADPSWVSQTWDDRNQACRNYDVRPVASRNQGDQSVSDPSAVAHRGRGDPSFALPEAGRAYSDRFQSLPWSFDRCEAGHLDGDHR
ncbi:MAG: hypothetical protein HN760_03740 [Microbacteriaceae bacterium]|nr:hypothetical protein [Microbacteriaceae bacterium]